MSRVRGDDVGNFIVENIDALARVVINPAGGIDNPEDLPAVEELSNRADEPMFSQLFDIVFDLRDRVEAAQQLEMTEPAIKEWLIVHLNEMRGDIGAIFANNLRGLWNPAAEGAAAAAPAPDRAVVFDEFAETVHAAVAAVHTGDGEVRAPVAIRPATPAVKRDEHGSDDSDADGHSDVSITEEVVVRHFTWGRRRSEEVYDAPADPEEGGGGGGGGGDDVVLLAGVLAMSITQSGTK